jgi:hypothetical protein
MPTADILCEENRYGELSILDGVQRLICLQEFFSNAFRLQGLKLMPSLEGCRYSDLKYSQSSIFHNRTELGFTVISYDTDAILKFEFFKRVHSDSYRFPVQLARNYAFRDHLYFIRELQDATRNFLAPKDQHSYSFSMETTKSTHRDVSEFDELYLLLCSASLTYHNRMQPSNIRYSGKFSDLLDDTAIYLHQHSDDFVPLKSVVVEALSKARRYFGTPILFADLPKHKYQSHRNDVVILDSDSIVACFIDCLKDRHIDFDDITRRKIGYRSNRSSQMFLKELLN